MKVRGKIQTFVGENKMEIIGLERRNRLKRRIGYLKEDLRSKKKNWLPKRRFWI